MADVQYEEILLLVLLLRRRRRRRQKIQEKPKRAWVREIFRRRKEQGDHHNIEKELRLHDRKFYFRYENCMNKASGKQHLDQLTYNYFTKLLRGC